MLWPILTVVLGGLAMYLHRITSYVGEDGVLHEYFILIPISFVLLFVSVVLCMYRMAVMYDRRPS